MITTRKRMFNTINTINDVFRQTLVKGCHFHYAQNVWKKVKKYGLVKLAKQENIQWINEVRSSEESVMCHYEHEQAQKRTTRPRKMKNIRDDVKLKLAKTKYIEDKDFDRYQKVLRALSHRYIDVIKDAGDNINELDDEGRLFYFKHNQICTNVWKCFTLINDDSSDNDDYTDDDILEQINRTNQNYKQIKEQLTNETQKYKNCNDEFQNIQQTLTDYTRKINEIFVCISFLLIYFYYLFNFYLTFNFKTNSINKNLNLNTLTIARRQIDNLEITNYLDPFKKLILNSIDHNLQLANDINSLLLTYDISDDNQSLKDNLNIIKTKLEELEQEKQNLSYEHNSREETFRNELDQLAAEKDSFWQQHVDEECDRVREQCLIEQNRKETLLKNEFDEQIIDYNNRLKTLSSQNNDFLQRLNLLQKDSAIQLEETNTKLQICKTDLENERERQTELLNMISSKDEQLIRNEREKNDIIKDLSGEVDIYKEQVKQFSITILQLEKSLLEEQQKRIKLQEDVEQHKKQHPKEIVQAPTYEVLVPAVPVIEPADLSHELFAYKSRIQEQDQIIVSLRRDLSGAAARLSDVQGELSEKQKRQIEKNETLIREQTRELGDTRSKLSKLSDIVDKQSRQIESLQTDLTKAKALSNQYQLLVDQKQAEIERLSKTVEQKNIIVERAEKSKDEEGRITHELVAVGAQCKGERHEQTISRQREALNELRARIKNLEQLRPANPPYEKVLQQVILLKKELAELRARQALPMDIPSLTSTSSQQNFRVSPNDDIQNGEVQKIIEERTAHADTMNVLQTCEEVYSTLVRRLAQLLELDDEISNVTPLSTLGANERYAGLQQRQRAADMLTQKIEMLRDRLSRKEELLRDYEKDLGKLRQAEILIKEKNMLLQDLEVGKRTNEDEALFLRSTLKQTQDQLNHEQRVNTAIKLGRNIDGDHSTDLIRRSGSKQSTTTLHHHCPPDIGPKIKTVKKEMNQKIARKDYEIKTLKQELHEALDTLSEQSHRVKLAELQSRDTLHES
ncbi:unnamed protein product [Didymodactylos carnosus]|uniref:Uncharacterized protein n=1 Tax=Didymodactylos carnosus TaxID=1234261 RepID=A0A814BG89_9BILA|nr:unnamed protein product [Didymodactylos carnosus]CAF3706268.1 unnamed protein product [Didymodactylos carnosus]